jgi:hypothetical protein
MLQHSIIPSLRYSNSPLLFQHGNRLDLQQGAGGLELSRLHEGAGRIACFKYFLAHVGDDARIIQLISETEQHVALTVKPATANIAPDT